MKRISVLIFLINLACSYTCSQENIDSIKKKLQSSVTFSINSNGISSIPAFSLGKPAVMADITLTKNRFTYEPVLAFGLEMKAWFIDNWIRYRIINKPLFVLRTGLNFSTFFSDYKSDDTEIRRSERYFAIELTGIYKFSSTSSILFSYWNDRGQETGSLTGHFINIIAEKKDLPIGNTFLISGYFQLFYVDYDGNNDGLFISPRLSSSVKNLPISLYFQIIQALKSNITPNPGFRWNIGLSYTI